ncbi:MAG: hypothetical protein NZ899_14800 [Thermoguttaceae bacterium]|nr:hypothetical protein [Thermoguttaceae bacterium]MDW8080205.1 hypothetical protein [Thermoguttaceae bacterium]
MRRVQLHKDNYGSWGEYVEFGIFALIGIGSLAFIGLLVYWTVISGSDQTEKARLVAASRTGRTAGEPSDPVLNQSTSRERQRASKPRSPLPPSLLEAWTKSSASEGSESARGTAHSDVSPASSSGEIRVEKPQKNSGAVSSGREKTQESVVSGGTILSDQRQSRREEPPAEAKAGKLPSSSLADSPAETGSQLSAGGFEHRPGPGLSEKLAERTSLQFVDTPLADVLAVIGEKHGIVISLDEGACKQVGISRDMPVTLAVWDITLEDALRKLAEPLALQPLFRGDSVILVPTERPAERPIPWLQAQAQSPGDLPESGTTSSDAPSPSLLSKLRQRVNFSFRDTPLNQVLSVISSEHGIPIRIEQEKCAAVGILTDVPVTLVLEDVPLSEGLAALVEPLGLRLEYRQDLVFVVPKPPGDLREEPPQPATSFPLVEDDKVPSGSGPNAEQIKQAFEFAQELLPPVQVSDEGVAELLINTWGIKSISQLQAAAVKVRYASEYYLLLQVFKRLHRLNAEEERSLKTLLDTWRDRAQSKLVRLGVEWLPPEDWLKRKNAARQAFIRGLLLISQGYEGGMHELNRAARLDTEFISAHFYLGMIYALGEANFLEAANAFERCLRRSSGVVATLNNLAICHYRLGALGTTLNYLKRRRAGGRKSRGHAQYRLDPQIGQSRKSTTSACHPQGISRNSPASGHAARSRGQ